MSKLDERVSASFDNCMLWHWYRFTDSGGDVWKVLAHGENVLGLSRKQLTYRQWWRWLNLAISWNKPGAEVLRQMQKLP